MLRSVVIAVALGQYPIGSGTEDRGALVGLQQRRSLPDVAVQMRDAVCTDERVAVEDGADAELIFTLNTIGIHGPDTVRVKCVVAFSDRSWKKYVLRFKVPGQ
jgi:hypothetical protein